MSWQTGRPVFERLPVKGYQDNDPTDWLTRWVDEKLVEKATQLQEFYKNLNILTCPDSYLDFLAYLVGMSGQYWDTRWSTTVKRAMITVANYVWSNRGTFAAIRTVLNIHLPSFVFVDGDSAILTDGDLLAFGSGEGDYTIWTTEGLRLPFTLPSPQFGRDELRFHVLLNIKYSRRSYGFREAQRTLRNFAPATVQSSVCYDKFYLGFSAIGDPIFGQNPPLEPLTISG